MTNAHKRKDWRKMTSQERLQELCKVDLDLPMSLEAQAQTVARSLLRRVSNSKIKDIAEHMTSSGSSTFLKVVVRYTYTKGGAFYSLRADIGDERPEDITEGKAQNAFNWSVELRNVHPDNIAYGLEVSSLETEIKSVWLRRQAKLKWEEIQEALYKLEEEELEELKQATEGAEAFRFRTDYTSGSQIEAHAVREAIKKRETESNHEKLMRLKKQRGLAEWKH